MRVPVAIAAACLCSCSGARPVAPSAKVVAETQKIEVKSQTLAGLEAVVTVNLRNDGDAPATATSASWEVVTGGQVKQSGTIELGTQLPPGADILVDLTVPFRYADKKEDVLDLVERKEPIEYAVRGTIAVGGSKLEFAKADAVKPPRLPKLSLSSIEAVRGPESGFRVNASIELENPNPFSLPMKGLHWKVLLNGQVAGEGTTDRDTEAKPASHTTYPVTISFEPSEVKARAELQGATIPFQLVAELEVEPADIELEAKGDLKVLRAE